jgi:hypothetical protein
MDLLSSVFGGASFFSSDDSLSNSTTISSRLGAVEFQLSLLVVIDDYFVGIFTLGIDRSFTIFTATGE